MDTAVEILVRELSYDSLKKLSKMIRDEKRRRKNIIRVEQLDDQTIQVRKHRTTIRDLLLVQDICGKYGNCTHNMDGGKITVKYTDARDCTDAMLELKTKFLEKN